MAAAHVPDSMRACRKAAVAEIHRGDWSGLSACNRKLKGNGKHIKVKEGDGWELIYHEISQIGTLFLCKVNVKISEEGILSWCDRFLGPSALRSCTFAQTCSNAEIQVTFYEIWRDGVSVSQWRGNLWHLRNSSQVQLIFIDRAAEPELLTNLFCSIIFFKFVAQKWSNLLSFNKCSTGGCEWPPCQRSLPLIASFQHLWCSAVTALGRLNGSAHRGAPTCSPAVEQRHSCETSTYSCPTLEAKLSLWFAWLWFPKLMILQRFGCCLGSIRLDCWKFSPVWLQSVNQQWQIKKDWRAQSGGKENKIKSTENVVVNNCRVTLTCK